MANATYVGSIVALRRYPIKSMQGEELDSVELTEGGLLGDRGYALLDRATGHIASAKHPGKWAKLLACRAAFVTPPQLGVRLPPVAITLPDGAVINSAQEDVDAVLSHILGRDVELLRVAPVAPTREADRSPTDDPSSLPVIREEALAVAAPPGTFFDYAVLHVLTTATLNHLRCLFPAGDFELRRFRPNIVVAPVPEELEFVENRWLSHALRIGTDVQVQLIDPCPRCVVPTLAQGDLPHDPGILRAIARHNAAASITLAPGVVFPAVAGVYGSVLHTGSLGFGDGVWLW